MVYKFVFGDGEIELSPGMSNRTHHFTLLERIMDRVGEVESYIGGYFSEDDFHGGQFDSVEINWPGVGDVPSLDELKQMIQLQLGRFRFDTEEIMTARVQEMKLAYNDLESWENETGKDHTTLYPFIWYKGRSYVGMPRGGHMALVERYYDELIGPYEDYDYYNVEGEYYIGRITRGGEAISWDSQSSIPSDIAAEIQAQRKLGATSEDTEPMGLEVGFLREPRKELYPPMFDGAEPKPAATRTVKNHVLNQLALNNYEDADQWIHFSIYGSGISFNWDEAGDMDVQMWVDVDLFNERHPKAPFTADELVAETRRIVQMVNFPSFHELGLSTDDVKGEMLIQYYPKPGKGTLEENMASKPYSCYDMDQEKWLQRPTPIDPTFYGEHFLMVMNKAEEIAKQAEALLEQLSRNTLTWQFWTTLYNKYRNDKYLDAAELAERNADAEKLGVQELFKGVFGDRAKAYSEEGEGIQDERDIVQKLLEVWGVFQRLKHFARQPLPWEEQELPAEPDKTREEDGPLTEEEEPDHPSKSSSESIYVPYALHSKGEGALYLGFPTSDRGQEDYHAAVIERLVGQGVQSTYDDPGWTYGYLYHANGVIDEIEPWSDEYQSAIDSGEERELVMRLWPLRKQARRPHWKRQRDRKEKRKPKRDKQNWEPMAQPKYVPKKFEPPVPYSLYDFRIKPGDPIPPIGPLTRWQWSPGTGMHMWNPPATGEVFHAMYAPYMENGENDWMDQNMPSGYLLSDGAIFAYNDKSLARWEPQVLESMTEILGYKPIITTNMADKNNGEVSSLGEAPESIYDSIYQLDDYSIDVSKPMYYDKEREMYRNVESSAMDRGSVYFTEAPSDEMYPYSLPVIVNINTGDIFLDTTGTGHYTLYELMHDLGEGVYEEYHGYFHNTSQASFLWYGDEYSIPPQEEQETIHRRIRDAIKLPVTSSFWKVSDWSEIMQNATALREAGAVTITSNEPNHVEGTVKSQTRDKLYTTTFDREDPNSSAITVWNCNCEWGEVSWGRTRQWKKYEGRPCKHTLALYWESQVAPTLEDRGQQILFDPGEAVLNDPGSVVLNDGGLQSAPGPGGPNMGPPLVPATPAPAPAPPPPANSVITKPGEGGTVSLPGTFSKAGANNLHYVETGHTSPEGFYKIIYNWERDEGWWWFTDPVHDMPGHLDMVAELDLWEAEAEETLDEWTLGTGDRAEDTFHVFSKLKTFDFQFESAFYNGQVVRTKLPMWGIDRDDNAQMVPQGATGEVLWSDDKDTIAIFPLDTGALEPHLVRVQGGTEGFTSARAKTPFVRRMR